MIRLLFDLKKSGKELPVILMTVGLTKKQETLIRSLHTRHGRRKSGLCLCEGLRCCREAWRARPDLLKLAVKSEGVPVEGLDIDFITVSAAEMRKLAATASPQGVLLVMGRPEPPTADEPVAGSFVILLDGVADPGNLGTIVRTAKAVGVGEIWLTAGSADPFSDKAIRSALGFQFDMVWREFRGLDYAAEFAGRHGVKGIYRTEPAGGKSCFDEKMLFDRSLIIFGGEANGAADLPSATALTIPMPGGAESINVAQAATIILFESVRRGTAVV